MRILLTGKDGQVGRELKATLSALGELTATNRSDLNLTKAAEIRRVVAVVRPQIIVNAAAYTAVDKAEADPDIARLINAVAPAILAEEARKVGALLVHYSTDYVFDGTKDGPYTENDAPNPINVYGHTKLEGERSIQEAACHHLIVRTSWVYAERGRNFLLTILRVAREQGAVRAVGDQIGAPTSSVMIARATEKLIANAMREHHRGGVYHMTAQGAVSWYGFARAIVEAAGIPAKVTAISSVQYPTAARRPRNSVLDNSKLQALSIKLPAWQQGLHEILARCS